MMSSVRTRSAGRDLPPPFRSSARLVLFPKRTTTRCRFLERGRRVPVKRGPLPRGRLGRILVISGVVGAFCAVVALCLAVHSFFMTDARFRIETASSIQVLGNSQVTRPELLSVFGGDIGRNIFHVPLNLRRAELEELPWVEHATVMRLLPNQLRVAVTSSGCRSRLFAQQIRSVW